MEVIKSFTYSGLHASTIFLNKKKVEHIGNNTVIFHV